MPTKYRRQQVSDRISEWHMRDVRNVTPKQWFTEDQFIASVAGAFVTGVGMALAVIWCLAQ